MRLDIRLFNDASGPTLERRVLRPAGNGIHQALHGEVRTDLVGRRTPFDPPPRARRLHNGVAQMELPSVTPGAELFHDIEVVVYGLRQPLPPTGDPYVVPQVRARVRLDVRNPAAIVACAVPPGTANDEPWLAAGHPHPRVIIENGQRPTLWIDVTFIDVTHSLETLSAQLGARRGPQDARVTARLDKLKPITYNDARAEGVTMRVMQYTGGTPAAWLVMVPGVPPSIRRYGALVFYRPTAGIYNEVPEVALDHLFRYWKSPPRGFPWFIGPVESGGRPYYPSGPDDTHPLPTTMGEIYMPCGWLAQLARAHSVLRRRGAGHEAPIMVHPVPSGIEYGRAASFSGMRHALRAIWRTLASDRLVDWSTSPDPRRIAINGFSAGGEALYRVVRESVAPGSGEPISELYCHDPNGTRTNLGLITRWFTADQDRRLRFFAGDQQPLMAEFVRRHRGGPGTRVWLEPPNHAFWSGPMYRAAQEEPLHTRPGRTPYQQFAVDPPDGFRPVQTRVTIGGLRHQWAVAGGTGNTLDAYRHGDDFVGYLERALIDSGF